MSQASGQTSFNRTDPRRAQYLTGPVKSISVLTCAVETDRHFEIFSFVISLSRVCLRRSLCRFLCKNFSSFHLLRKHDFPTNFSIVVSMLYCHLELIILPIIFVGSSPHPRDLYMQIPLE